MRSKPSLAAYLREIVRLSHAYHFLSIGNSECRRRFNFIEHLITGIVAGLMTE